MRVNAAQFFQAQLSAFITTLQTLQKLQEQKKKLWQNLEGLGRKSRNFVEHLWFNMTNKIQKENPAKSGVFFLNE
jgi:hypothetical protein